MLDFNLTDIIASASAAAAGSAGVALRLFKRSERYQRWVAMRKDKAALIDSREKAETAAALAAEYARASAAAASQWQSAANAMDSRISALEESDKTKTRTISNLRTELEDMWSRFRVALHFIINQLDYTRVLRKLLFEHLPDHPVPEPPVLPPVLQDAVNKEQGKEGA